MEKTSELPIFPEYLFKKRSIGWDIVTYIRKKYKGIYYLIPLRYEYNGEIIDNYLYNIILDSYNTILNYNIQKTINKPYYNFIVDDNQESEKNRVKKLSFTNKMFYKNNE